MLPECPDCGLRVSMPGRCSACWAMKAAAKNPFAVDPVIPAPIASHIPGYPDVRMQFSDDQETHQTIGLEILCGAASPCKVPETCVHVRAGLKARVDAEVIKFLLRDPTYSPAFRVVRIRIPLADRLWLTADISGTDNVIAKPRGLGILAPVMPFELGNHGTEDVKWKLVNYAATQIDYYNWKNVDGDDIVPLSDWHNLKRCPECDQPIIIDISAQKDFAWVVSWLNTPIPESMTCYDCIKREAARRYSYRASLAFALTISSENW